MLHQNYFSDAWKALDRTVRQTVKTHFSTPFGCLMFWMVLWTTIHKADNLTFTCTLMVRSTSQEKSKVINFFHKLFLSILYTTILVTFQVNSQDQHFEGCQEKLSKKVCFLYIFKHQPISIAQPPSLSGFYKWKTSHMYGGEGNDKYWKGHKGH